MAQANQNFLSHYPERGAGALPISKPIFSRRMGNKRVRTGESPEISTKGKCSFIFPAASKLLSEAWVALLFAYVFYSHHLDDRHSNSKDHTMRVRPRSFPEEASLVRNSPVEGGACGQGQSAQSPEQLSGKLWSNSLELI